MTPPAASPRLAWILALLLASAGASVAVVHVRDTMAPVDTLGESVLYVRSPAVLGRLALSYDTLVADVYWMRAIQHFGDTRRRQAGPRRYELLYPLLDITTALDPKFTIAYRFGAIFLSEPPPGGPGRPDLAIQLLERGLQARPDNWRFMQDIGFVNYFWRHDYASAAAWFDKAAAAPGAPWWMKSLAANTRSVGGDRQGARALWTALYESAGEGEWLRTDARRRLQQLDALDAVDQLQGIVRSWAATGAPKPYTWQGLVRAGRLRGIPADPAGAPFHLDPDTGEVAVDADSPLRPLPTELAVPK